jgi:hypothetical protein
MKKKSAFVLVIALFLASALLFAAFVPETFNYKVLVADQGKENKIPDEDLQVLSDHEFKKGDYTVRLFPGPGNTLGFDIRKGSQVIYLQQNNPFYPTPEGFISENDALNLAWWVVDKHKTTGKRPRPADFNETLEKELNIKRRDTY